MKSLPVEVNQIGINAEKFHWSDGKSLRGPCPKCGGTRRFVLFVDKPFPSWNYFCDNCGIKGFISDFNDELRKPVTDEERQAWEIENRRKEEERAAYRREKLAEFSTSELWEELHERMTDENRAWWRSAGIPDEWQNFWKLGYTASHNFMHQDVYYKRPAYTIPKFGLGWNPLNIDYRLIDPPAGVGKYRPKPDLPPAFFMSHPDYESYSPDGHLFILEGSKKAAVTCIYLGGKLQVWGVPSCNSWAGAEKAAAGMDTVWLVFDPDAEVWVYKLGHAIKAHSPATDVRILHLPTKIDDAFLHYGLTASTLRGMLKTQCRTLKG